MSRKTVHPAEGRKVRDPETGQAILATGATIRWSPYWQRRLDDGDLCLVVDPAPAPTPAKPSRKES